MANGSISARLWWMWMLNKGSTRKSSLFSSANSRASLYSERASENFFSIIAIPASAFKATTVLLRASSPSILVLLTRTWEMKPLKSKVLHQISWKLVSSLEEYHQDFLHCHWGLLQWAKSRTSYLRVTASLAKFQKCVQQLSSIGMGDKNIRWNIRRDKSWKKLAVQ